MTGVGTKATKVQVPYGPGQGREGKGRVAPAHPSLAACPGPEDFHRAHEWLGGTGEAVLCGRAVPRQVCTLWEQITLPLKIKK